ncbi:MAG: D-alanyl-D-alanine carboxypeptidase [Actinomycetia bacterium]|nr:D-alanyl-D-alanine carboxypeptidase [Actinomycetes bacterium]MCH9800370.1 D-alanyl-D-alanine carboxypeptidase [Actinomycetes bacterium]
MVGIELRKSGHSRIVGVTAAGAGLVLGATLLAPTAAAEVPVWPSSVRAALPTNLQLPATTTTADYLPTLIKRLKKRSRAKSLGRKTVSVFVSDLETGQKVFKRRAGKARIPASVMKSATALTVMSARGAYHQFTTSVTRSADGMVLTLVGGGDPLLDSNDLKVLATETAAALSTQGSPAGRLRLQVDDSIFAAPTHPSGWPSHYYPNYARKPFGLTRRWVAANDGAIDAGKHFRKELKRAVTELTGAGLRVRRKVTRPIPGGDIAPPPATPVASEPTTTPTPAASPTEVAPTIESGVIATFAEHSVMDAVNAMLPSSDNSIAENLIRHVAAAKDMPTTATGAAAAVTAELKRLQIPMRRIRIVDGSGLSRQNQLTAKAATAINRAMLDPARPELALGVFAMPRAGVSGTLSRRFGAGLTRCARDKVMAKTGTLSSVVSLSGVAGARDGRPRAFTIFINDFRSSTTSARYWTDAMATAVTGCG